MARLQSLMAAVIAEEGKSVPEQIAARNRLDPRRRMMEALWDSMNEEERAEATQQNKEMLAELRSLASPNAPAAAAPPPRPAPCSSIGAAADGAFFPPPQHVFENGRGVAFAAGTPWSVLDRVMTPASDSRGEEKEDCNAADTLMSIVTCIPAVQLVERALFCPSSPVVDVDTAMLIEIADIFDIHPDSVRKLAYHLHARWKRGLPFTCVRSFAVADPSKPLTDAENMCQTYTVNYGHYSPYDPATHCAQLTCEAEFRHADFKNYLYVPSKQPIKGQYRLSLYSCVSKYSPVPLAKFKAAVSNLRALDANWYRTLCVAMVDRMSARFVLHLCCEVVSTLTHAQCTAVVHFQREKKVVAITFDETVHVRIDGPSLIPMLDNMANSAETLNRCKQCGINHSRVRCKHCCELRYCTEACREAEWAASHKAQCRVFAKKTRGLAQPPGGAAMVKEKDKMQRDARAPTQVPDEEREDEMASAPGGPQPMRDAEQANSGEASDLQRLRDLAMG